MNHVLVVTEDKAIALSLRIVLKENFLVEEVRPSEIFNVLPARRPNVIFLDSQFSSADSRELRQRLLETDATLTVIQLVMSFDRTAQEAMETGVFDVLEKPFDAERLRHLLGRALERDRMLREIEVLRKNGNDAGRPETVSEGTKEGDSLFELLIEAIGDHFPDVKNLCQEILKVLRRCFRFSNLVIFLKNQDVFSPVASLGFDTKFLEGMELESQHPLIAWFLKKGCLLKADREGNLAPEIRNFLEMLNSRIVLPCKTFQGRLLGFFVVGGKLTGETVTSQEVRTLSLFCDYTTMVLENVFLYTEANLQKDYQEAIFTSVPSGIIGVDRDGRVRILNKFAERILGITHAEVEGKYVEKLGPQIADYLRKALRLQAVVSREEFVYVPTRASLGISTSCLKKEGKIEGAVAIFQDLTLVKELENRQKEVERNMYWNTMASRLSHELKNPLVAIKTFAQMLPARYDDQEFRTSFSRVVQEEVSRLNGIIEKINRLADSRNLNLGFFDLRDLLESLREKYEKQFTSKDIRFELSKESCLINGDSLRIKEALEYIIDFCVEDVSSHSKISCGCRLEGDRAVLEVLENGNKFDLARAEDVFVPFSPCLESTLSIGMALARKILEAHQGSLEMEQEVYGKKFRITLPGKNSET